MSIFNKTTILKVLVWLLLGCNLLLLSWLEKHGGSMWGWTFTDLADGYDFAGTDGVAVLQLVLLAVNTDVFMRWAVIRFNSHSKKAQIPAILVQGFSILIYAMFGLASFILLFDHSATYLLAASGAIGLSVGYICKDLIADIVNSIVIQTDRLIAINDWIEIAGGEKPVFYQVIQFDHRMVTLKDKYDYLFKIPNTRFMGMSYVNLTKQQEGRGSRRDLDIQLDSVNHPEKVLEVLNLALEALLEKNKDFVHTYFCGVGRIAEGAVIYRIQYECIPSMKITESESAVMRTVLRFLTAAGINTRNSIEVEEFDNHASKTSNRLYETYEYGILKVLSYEEVMQLSKTASTSSCFKGEQLIRHGEQADSMFLISEGALEVKIHDKKDQLVTVATLWPGDCVGEMSLLTGAPRSADVFAKTDAVLIEIKKDNIAPILESNPRLINEISDLLAKRQAQSASALNATDSEGLREKSQNLAKKILGFFSKAFVKSH